MKIGIEPTPNNLFGDFRDGLRREIAYELPQ